MRSRSWKSKFMLVENQRQRPEINPNSVGPRHSIDPDGRWSTAESNLLEVKCKTLQAMGL